MSTEDKKTALKTTLKIDDLKSGDRFYRVNQHGLDTFWFVGINPKDAKRGSIVAINGESVAKATVLRIPYNDDYYTTSFENASIAFISFK